MASVMMKEGMAGGESQHDRRGAGQRQIGDVHIGFLRGEIGDHDAGRVRHAGDRQIDFRAQDDEGEADRDDAGHRHLGQDVAEVVERGEGGAGEAEEGDEADEREEGRDVAHLAAQQRTDARLPGSTFLISQRCVHAFSILALTPLRAGDPC
jgi:hypothetical protein